jgi:hypothetical protein
VLAFLAEHRLARVDHLIALLGVGANGVAGCVDPLAAAQLVRIRNPFEGRPLTVQITGRGLGAIGSDLPTPSFDWRGYAHDVGVAWVWLAARAGAFGELEAIVAERRMRSRDGPGRRSDPPLAVALGGVGPSGVERLHYPDLLLTTAAGRRVAVELELTAKAPARLEKILAGYGADPRVEVVLYLARARGVGDAVARAARRLGIPERVRVHSVVSYEPRAPAEVGGIAALPRAPAHEGVTR